MNDFLRKEDVVTRFSTRNEAGLERVYDVVQVQFESVNKDFGNNFVESVAKAYRAKLMCRFRFGNLRDEANEGRVPIFGYFFLNERC